MEKLKKVVSHKARKSIDATNEPSSPSSTIGPSHQTTTTSGLSGEGSHLAAAQEKAKNHSVSGTGSEGYHPIYNQFTKQKTTLSSGVPTATADNVPHFSNTTNVGQGYTAQNPPDSAKGFGFSLAQDQSTMGSNLHPDSSQSYIAVPDEISTASIKSGVLGFPQSESSHAAMSRTSIGGGLSTTEALNESVPGQPGIGDKTNTSHAGQDAALGAGALDAGTGLAAHELHRQPDHDNLKDAIAGFNTTDFVQTSKATSEQPFERSFNRQQSITTATDRSFPLSGGVVSDKGAGKPSNTHGSQAQSSTLPIVGSTTSTRQTENPSGTLSSQLRPTTNEREPGTKEKAAGVSDGHGREALAGAAAAASIAGGGNSGVPISSTPHEQKRGAAAATSSDAPLFGNASNVPSGYTGGPHVTDAANRLDPHLHVPGEFPETPLETPSAHGPGMVGILSGTTGTTGERPTAPITGSTSARDDPNIGATPPSDEQHHYGRDAAIMGGVGAAGLGAYEAGKHHQRETTDIGNEATRPHSSPYSATKIDPRVDLKPVGFQEQLSNPTAPKQSIEPHQTSQPITSQRETLPTSEQMTAQELSQGEMMPQSEHHYGRDAGLVGAGAAVAGGAHHAGQLGKQQDTGPATATIGPHKSNVANILDPRVQPDKSLQQRRKVGPTAEDPASATIGPHTSNIANIFDPRVQPDPAKQKQHVTTGPHQSDTLNRLDPKVDAHAQQPEGQHYDAAGASAYTASRSYDKTEQPELSQDDQKTGGHSRYDSAQDPYAQQQPHSGRNLAAAGGATGLAGTGAYAYSQQQDKDAEEERLAQQKAHERELEHQRKQQQKEFEKKQKEQEKAFQRQQKESKKQQAAEQKQHNKFVAAEDRTYQKSMEQARHQQETAPVPEEENKEKKHHLFGFLHRDKDKKSSPESSPRHSWEHEGRHRLHKDPPPKVKDEVERKAETSKDSETGKRDHVGVDGPIGDAYQVSGDRQTRPGVYGAHPIDEEQHFVTGPHTGLPMNTEKYGDGRGGSDESKTVEGYYQAAPRSGQLGDGSQGVTDYDAIKKENTPY